MDSYSFVPNENGREEGEEFTRELEKRINIIEKRLDMFERYINATAATGDSLQMFHDMRINLKKEIHQMNLKVQI